MSIEPKASTLIPPVIISGVGIGDVKIGDSPEKVVAAMKSPGVLSDYETEYKIFNDYGYVPEHYLQFLLEFDKLLIFQEDDNPAYPVFKVYFKDNAAVFMIISSYGTDVFDYNYCRQIETEKGISFGDSEEDIFERYGKEDINHIYGNYDGDYIYLKLGVSFIFDEKKLRVIRVFKQLSDSKKISKLKTHYKKLK